MIEEIKNKLIRKWFKEYASELNSLLLLVPDDKYDEIKDLKGDLEICEKVFERYNMLVN